MSEPAVTPDSLVLYKKRPARVLKSGERLEIELDDRNQVKVRLKDITLLHPGPVANLHALLSSQPSQGDILLTWELALDGGDSFSLVELAELAFGADTPATAWAVWQWVEDGLYFQGTPESIRARPVEAVAHDQEVRQARQIELQARRTFIERAAQGRVSMNEDAHFLQEIIDLASGRRTDSRLLRDLGRSERPENAHALLLEWGIWDEWVDPHPARLGLPLKAPSMPLPELPDEPRLDLTYLETYAIDDRGNQDPDDALSLVECRVDDVGNFAGGRLWVHVADAAALVDPDSPADLEARARAATLYLPEGAVQMLPPQAIAILGLGLQDISPALSFDLKLDAKAQIEAVNIQPSWVRVRRLSYEDAEARLADEPFAGLLCIAQSYQASRRANGAWLIDLPEVNIQARDGRVSIEPLGRLRSRDLVREVMLMAGEAAAKFTMQHALPAPYAIQEQPNLDRSSENRPLASPGDIAEYSMAERFALRRRMRRSRVSSTPGPHAGVGIQAYCRATSPLRRYLDLVLHQQIRRHLAGLPTISEQALFERLGGHDTTLALVNTTEGLARRHWTLVYLLQNPGKRWVGVLVEVSGRRGTVLIPELSLEAPVHLHSDQALDTRLELTVRDIRLPELEVNFTLG